MATGPTALKTYQIPPNLKNPYRNPKLQAVTPPVPPVITPQINKITHTETDASKYSNEESTVTSTVYASNEKVPAEDSEDPRTNEKALAEHNEDPHTPVKNSSPASANTNTIPDKEAPNDSSESAQLSITMGNLKDNSHGRPEPMSVPEQNDGNITQSHHPSHGTDPVTVSNTPYAGQRSTSTLQNTSNPYPTFKEALEHNDDKNFFPSFFSTERKLHHSSFLDDNSKQKNSSLELHPGNSMSTHFVAA